MQSFIHFPLMLNVVMLKNDMPEKNWRHDIQHNITQHINIQHNNELNVKIMA
jgi:hypothetical protein